MIKIDKSILVKSLAVLTMVFAIMAGNAFCEEDSIPSDIQIQKDVLTNNDDDSVARELIEKGIIENVDPANIWDANFTAERDTPERAETTKRLQHRSSDVSNHGVANPTGVANPGGAVSNSQPGSVNAPQSTK